MKKIALGVAVGFAIMGFIGYIIKLIHIPINNILGGGVAGWEQGGRRL